MKVYIVDAIGFHSGVKYYIDSFQNSLEKELGVSVSILSNYNRFGKPFFGNFYSGNILKRILILLLGSFKLFLKTLFGKEDIFIVISYGTFVDALLVICSLFSKNMIVDIHEVIEQGSENKYFYNILFKIIFKHVDSVVIHSEKSAAMLKKLNYQGECIFFPHLKYNTDDCYNQDNLSDPVKFSIKENKIGLLFFGNITYSKGVDVLINCVKSLNDSVKDRLNIIIAGKNLDNTLENCDVNDDVFSITIQHLNDDEMKYLYSKTEYVVLPYRQTTQSGVLEMAFHYKKPVLVSNIPYFSMMLNDFPSFGFITELDEVSMHNSIEKIINDDIGKYYNTEDLQKYNNRDELSEFIRYFSNYINAIMRN